PVRLQSVRPRLSLGDPPSNPRALGSTLRHTLGLSGESRPFPLSDRRATFILRIDRRPAWVSLPHGLTLACWWSNRACRHLLVHACSQDRSRRFPPRGYPASRGFTRF